MISLLVFGCGADRTKGNKGKGKDGKLIYYYYVHIRQRLLLFPVRQLVSLDPLQGLVSNSFTLIKG